MSDQKHDKLEIYLLNNFGLIYAYINDLQNSLFSLSYPWTFCTQSIYTQFESFLPEPVVDSHPSQNYLWDSQGEPVEQPASRAAEASFVASFYLALGCFSCIFNFPSVIRGLLGIRGRLRLIEISITC